MANTTTVTRGIEEYEDIITFSGGLAVTEGAIISSSQPALHGLTVTAKAKATAVSYVAGINVNDYTGAAAQTVTLPAATEGVVVVHAQSVDTTGGTEALVFDCQGTDVFETGSVIETRNSSKVTFDVSVANETKLTFTPANATTNLMSIGSLLFFTCVNTGKWHISYDFQHLGAGTTGAFAFAA